MLFARRLRSPRPVEHVGAARVDHTDLARVLSRLQRDGARSLSETTAELADYRTALAATDPDTLDRSAALAYWINLYNAGALHRAGRAYELDLESVLRVPGAFSDPWVTVANETLSLDDIEHGKIRRFKDPRIHGALVCGSVSCPTLRHEPFEGETLDEQLDQQMRSFLASGGARLDRAGNTLHLTRVLMWYGNDFVRPLKMPTLVPTSKRRIATAVSHWLDPNDAAYVSSHRPKVAFAPYDWRLGCSIA